MKRFYILILISILLLLIGCGKKSSFVLVFDEFTMKFYDNDKQYIEVHPDTSSPGIKVLKKYKEDINKELTGFINSILVIRMPVEIGLDIEELVENNIKNLQLKLLQFQSADNEAEKVKCGDLQYSGYITTFSYQLDNETIYGGQYFFTDDEVLYLISLHSENTTDIQSFVKSAKTVKCIK